MKKFSLISTIEPEIESTWAAKVFLSFDIDWAHDDILTDTIDIVRDAGVASTWFVTHSTPLLYQLRNLADAELGIHPNFNPLLDGMCISSDNNSKKILESTLSLVPGARAIRSHSLTQNERIIDQFRDSGLTHISNCFVPHGCGIKVRPFRVWDDIVIVPHCWQDNVALKMSVPFPTEAELASDFHVFDFHPIHIFLNTEHPDRYEHTRHLHHKPEELIRYRYEGQGTRTRLLELLDLAE